ncbi:MAG: HAMP domain-containing protein [Candidatus Neomarinimicrobiota bacterium]
MKARSVSALIDKSLTMGQFIAMNLSPALHSQDKESMKEIIDAVRNYDELQYLVALDDSGRVFTSYNLSDAIGVDYQSASSDPDFGKDQLYYQTNLPIIFNKDTIGKLYLGFSLENLHREVYLIRYDGLILSLSILLIGFFIAIWMSNVMTGPLNQIVSTAEKITSGDHKQRVPILGSDEISRLGEAFNTMLDKLESAYEDVDKINKELEIIVESRTAALSITNAQLQSELRARRQAEKDLAAEKELIMITLSAIDDGVITTDTNGKIVLLNKAAETITGWMELHAAGESLAKVFRVDEHYLIDQTLNQILKNKQASLSLEKGTLLNKEDRPRAIIFTISAIRDNFGEIIGSVVIFRLAD